MGWSPTCLGFHGSGASGLLGDQRQVDNPAAGRASTRYQLLRVARPPADRGDRDPCRSTSRPCGSPPPERRGCDRRRRELPPPPQRAVRSIPSPASSGSSLEAMRALVRPRPAVSPRAAHPHRARRRRRRPGRAAVGRRTATPRHLGVRTVRVAGDDALPDSVFVEDAVVVFDDLAVLTSPGAEAAVPRRMRWARPSAGWASRRRPSSCRDPRRRRRAQDRAHRLCGPGRTHERRRHPATARPADAARIHGRRVPVTKVLHLNRRSRRCPTERSSATPTLDHPEIFPRFLAMPEHGAAAVVLAATPCSWLLGSGIGRARREPRLPGHHGRHQRVREARGLRDLSVGALRD